MKNMTIAAILFIIISFAVGATAGFFLYKHLAGDAHEILKQDTYNRDAVEKHNKAVMISTLVGIIAAIVVGLLLFNFVPIPYDKTEYSMHCNYKFQDEFY